MKIIYRNTQNLTTLIILFFTMNACESFVDVDMPKSQLTSSAVFENYPIAEAALTNIYGAIRDKGMIAGTNSGLSNTLGNYTDEMVAYGTPSNQALNFYNNSLLPTNITITDYWNTAYNQIYAANSIIEGSQASSKLTAENKKQLQGEALFIRALEHFYLVNLFGDIPYVISTDYKKNREAKRIPASEIYLNIIADLQNAANFLPVSYNTSERIRPNRYTAKALLARVYLYSGAYPEASNEASSVLNQADTYQLVKNIDAVFLINSKETIWQLKAAGTGQNTKEGATFILTYTPPSLTAMRTSLADSFNSSDLRRSNWVKSVTNGTTIWFFPFKYKQRNATATSTEYSVVFRLAEQYLIRAEARARQGDLIGAKEDLNVIRNRAGLTDTPAVSKDEILEAVLQERKWELFSEYGHRFFDLKRFNKSDLILSPTKPGWNTTDALFPIPQNELSANPYLDPQNTGY